MADLVERIAVAADEGRAALEQRLHRAGRRSCASTCRPTKPSVAQEIVARRRARTSARRLRGSAGTCRTGSRWPTAPEPCGRKLDFLLQEMNREVNTMGSKADGLRVSELIIAAKAELEKMREQVQNVE